MEEGQWLTEKCLGLIQTVFRTAWFCALVRDFFASGHVALAYV